MADEVYEYLVSKVIHRDQYETQSAPGNDKDGVPEKQLQRWKDDGGALPPQTDTPHRHLIGVGGVPFARDFRSVVSSAMMAADPKAHLVTCRRSRASRTAIGHTDVGLAARQAVRRVQCCTDWCSPNGRD